MESASQSRSFWMAHFQMPSHPALKQNLETDVCIIGAGIVGLTCAYLLSKSGKKVVVIEAGPTGGGQTARTTGHLVNLLDERYENLERLFGVEGSQLIAASHREAARIIESISLKESIDCHFERLDAYLFVPPGESIDILYRELEAATRAGIEVKMAARAPLDFDTGASLHFPHQAQFYPLRYMDGLIKAIEREGGEIYSQTHADQIDEGDKTKVTTSDGFQVIAGATIVATNTPINNRLLIHTKQAAYRTYVIAGIIPRGSVAPGLYYDTAAPYHYVRLAQGDKADEEFLIVGGEDHRTGQNAQPELCYKRLEQWTRERFPTLTAIRYRWSGQIIQPVDSIAFIGKNPFDKNIYIATGDSGNGLTHGTLGAVLITDLILGKTNSWKELYNPTRKNLKALHTFAKENLNTFAQYRDWLTSVEPETIIPPNTGVIRRKGAKKLAVFCDEHNQLHTFCAVCPHLGGIVRWNSAEKTWDCPCHGSRFTALGKAINGPTNTDLKKEN